MKIHIRNPEKQESEPLCVGQYSVMVTTPEHIDDPEENGRYCPACLESFKSIRQQNLNKMREEFKKTGVCPLECDDGELTYSTIGWSVDMENYERTVPCPVCSDPKEE
jgi:hypothetical protein